MPFVRSLTSRCILCWCIYFVDSCRLCWRRLLREVFVVLFTTSFVASTCRKLPHTVVSAILSACAPQMQMRLSIAQFGVLPPSEPLLALYAIGGRPNGLDMKFLMLCTLFFYDFFLFCIYSAYMSVRLSVCLLSVSPLPPFPLLLSLISVLFLLNLKAAITRRQKPPCIVCRSILWSASHSHPISHFQSSPLKSAAKAVSF